MNPNEAFNAPAPLVIPEQADPLVAYDLSPLRLFLDADPVVQGVMVLLAAASVGCWALIIERSWRLSALRRDVRKFETSLGTASHQNRRWQQASSPGRSSTPDVTRPSSGTAVKRRARRAIAANAQ